jgi:hypothetical protein
MFSLRPHIGYDVYAKMLKDFGIEVIVIQMRLGRHSRQRVNVK